MGNRHVKQVPLRVGNRLVLLINLLMGHQRMRRELRSRPVRTDSEQARWWTWALALPAETSPLAGGNADSCTVGQPVDGSDAPRNGTARYSADCGDNDTAGVP